MPDTEIAQGQADVSVPTLNASPEVPVGASASQGFNEDAVVDKIVARLRPDMEKMVQSTKDKRLAQLDKLGGVDDLLALKDYIKAREGNVDAAVRDYQLDQLIAQRSIASPAAGGAAAVVEQPNDIKTWTAEVLSDAGIAYDDTEYLELVKKPVASRSEWDRNLTKFVAKRNKQTVNPGAASAVAGGTGAAATVTGGDEAKLNVKYARLRELQQAPPTLQTRKELKVVSDEINKLGGHA